MLEDILTKILGLIVRQGSNAGQISAETTLIILLLFFVAYSLLDYRSLQINAWFFTPPLLYILAKYRVNDLLWLLTHYAPVGIGIVLYHYIVHEKWKEDVQLGKGDYMMHIILGFYVPPLMHLAIYVIAQALGRIMLTKLKLRAPLVFPYALPLTLALIVNLVIAVALRVYAWYYTPWYLVSDTLGQYFSLLYS